MRIIDLSVALKAGIVSDPPPMLPSIEYRDHQEGVKEFVGLFPGLKPEQLVGGEGPAIEKVTITTHNGTHLDAPWHFSSTMDGGKPALKIDEVPLEWFFSSGVKLDFRDKPDGYVCKADDVKRELDRIGYTLEPLDIVVVNTAAAAAYGKPDFLDKGCGMGREATLYLTERGVRVTGILLYAQAVRRNRRRQHHLGGPQGEPRNRLLPHGKAHQSRSVAAVRFQGVLLPGQGRGRVRRLDPLRRFAGRLGAGTASDARRNELHC